MVTRLTQIADTRGFTVAFAWTEATSGNWRVQTATLGNSNVGVSYQVDLIYDSYALLSEVRYPARSILYDNGGTGSLDSLDQYYASGLGFEYDTSSRMAVVKRLLRTGASSWSSRASPRAPRPKRWL